MSVAHRCPVLLAARDQGLAQADLLQEAAGKNRTMALGFTAFAIAIFTAVIAIGMIDRMMGS